MDPKPTRSAERGVRQPSQRDEARLQALEERLLRCEREIAHLHELVRQCARQSSELEERVHEEVD